MEILAVFFLFCGVVFGTIEVVEHIKEKPPAEKTEEGKHESE